MAEPSFEFHVQRLFGEPVVFPDAAAFAATVQGRLDRGWALRRILIGVAGVAGGMITAVQFVSSNFAERANLASHSAYAQFHAEAAAAAARAELQIGALHLLPAGGEAVWLVAGLAALGLALVTARVLDTF